MGWVGALREHLIEKPDSPAPDTAPDKRLLVPAESTRDLGHSRPSAVLIQGLLALIGCSQLSAVRIQGLLAFIGCSQLSAVRIQGLLALIRCSLSLDARRYRLSESKGCSLLLDARSYRLSEFKGRSLSLDARSHRVILRPLSSALDRSMCGPLCLPSGCFVQISQVERNAL